MKLLLLPLIIVGPTLLLILLHKWAVYADRKWLAKNAPRIRAMKEKRMSKERDNKIKALAVQLYYVAAASDEGGVVETPGDLAVHLGRWSPLRTLVMWDALTPEAQAMWLDHAQKVAPFTGILLEDKKEGSHEG